MQQFMNDVISQWVNGEFEEVFYATYIIIVPKYQLGIPSLLFGTQLYQMQTLTLTL